MAQDKPFPFEIDQESDVPLWVQLRQRIAYLIDSGYFHPGDKLPTVRGLAAELAINYNTVNKAYVDLASNGYLESTRGRGAFVRGVAADEGREHAQEIDGIIDECIAACRELGLSLDDVQRSVEARVMRMKREERMKRMAATQDGTGRIVPVDIGETTAQRAQSGA